MRINRSPLRTIVKVAPDERRVLMDHLDCGHALTHDGYANRQTRRRCPKCRTGASAKGH
jgi:hypothetical protein